MFGHNTTDQISQDQQSDAHVPLPADTLQDLTGSPAIDAADQPAGAPPVHPEDQITHTVAPTIQPPTVAPTADDQATTTFPPASDELGEEPTSPPAISTPITQPTAPAEAHEDLLSIKQEALTSLSPLVHNLELESEEKFKTLMMLIQASDNHELVKEAYAAAQAIPDEKVRAQALLDVVNEINYFTHGKEEDKA